MPNLALRAIARAPGLRRIPILKFLALWELVELARDHANKLEPGERRRVFELVRKAGERRGKLDQGEREELIALVMKAEPRIFAGRTLDAVSPVPLPKRFTHGPKRPAPPAAAQPPPVQTEPPPVQTEPPPPS